MNIDTDAEDRDETPAPAENESPAEVPQLGDAEKVQASSIVAEDTDRPVADNKLNPAEMGAPEAEPSENLDPIAGLPKKRGRKAMTPEEKALSAKAREEFKAFKSGRPDFSKLPGTQVGGPPPSKQRDYYAEAMSLFIPSSFLLEKWLGEHWGIAKVEQKIEGQPSVRLELSDEQKAYLAQMARWLEYEQFPEVSPRWGFMIASVGYAAPRLKTEPTPQRLWSAWEWVRVKLLRKEPRAQKKPAAEKQ